VRNYEDAKRTDTRRFAAFFHQMLKRGAFLAPSQFEALFVSAAHQDGDIDRTIEVCSESFAAIAS
jgi:glutamate-1-semialdehyde 2,1-aminomutase